MTVDRYTQLRQMGFYGTQAEMEAKYIKDTSGLDTVGEQLSKALDVQMAQDIIGIGNKVDKNSLVYNIQDFGALGTWNGSTGADDSPALSAAVAAVQAVSTYGGAIYFPPLPAGRKYRFTQPFPNVGGMRYFGQVASATELDFTASSMFTLTTPLNKIIFENLYLVAVGGHLINLGATGSFSFGRFENCILDSQSTGYSLVNQNGSGDFIENLFTNCDMYRLATATVPAFNIINTSGGANTNLWKKCRAWSNGCTSSPFWRIEASASGTYAYDNTWENIVGEQNAGGVIHLYSVKGAIITNVNDHDNGAYVDHVFKIDKSPTNALNPLNVSVTNCGRRGGTLNTGIKDFYAPLDGPLGFVLTNIGNSTATPVTQMPRSDSVIIGALGAGYSYQTFRVTSGAVFDGFTSDAALTVGNSYASGRGLDVRENVSGYAGQVLHARKFTDTGDHFVMDGNGKQQWGPGDGTFDVSLERSAAGTLKTGAGHTIRTGQAVTGSRPSASTVGAGAMFYDTTLSKPIWSNGTVWKDATGATV